MFSKKFNGFSITKFNILIPECVTQFRKKVTPFTYYKKQQKS